ncbi:MAG TPA: HD-GYP domain-containing protein [Treponema sp.]|nr:MAG: phosphohydrolase [Treponema sp. GWA1_62_8]OHE67850.1 MAG: phosphohydrolase [Treponema sp. GWC1_61_84]HCM27299.1 HD-GYP domain-containing protein [Treponema sp.]
MNSHAIKDIVAGSFFSEPVYLDGRFIVSAPEMPFTSELVRALLDWEFREVLSDGIPQANYLETKPAEETVVGESSPSVGDTERIRRATEFYRGFHEYVETLFTRFVTKTEINVKDVAEKVKELCETVKEDRRFLLRVQDPGSADRNYLASHTVKSTIIAVVLGSYLKLPNHRLIELGTAAILHEIGMVKLPPQLYMTDRPLTPPEKKAILTHPVLGYNILRSMNFPLSVCIAALEHHERENGEGYPRRLTTEKISLYAKIISVACSYEALTAVRPYKGAKDGYAGMIDLLKNVGKQYDDLIVRALVFSLSIYPIGLYVLLSNGRKAQVVDVNPENPRFPIVQVFGEKTPDGKDRLLETSQAGVYIVRPLVKDEVAAGKAD